MANATVSNLGKINNAGADDALFMKQYAGEVLTAFAEEYPLAGRVTERNISNGKSASFPAIGTVGSGYHTAGAEITGRVIEHNEVIITLDKMLISDAFIASLDEAMNHYEVRSEYSRQQGLELAKQRTRNELRSGLLASRVATALVPGQPGGALIKNTTMHTDATVLANALRSARQTFDEKFIPDSECQVALAPAQYYLLTSNKDLCDRDYNPNADTSFANAVISSVARIQLVKTTFMPNTDESADSNVLAKYRGNWANTVGLVWHKSAIGTLKLLDLSMESEYDIRRQGTLMLAKYALGHGALRAGAAIELSKAP